MALQVTTVSDKENAEQHYLSLLKSYFPKLTRMSGWENLSMCFYQSVLKLILKPQLNTGHCLVYKQVSKIFCDTATSARNPQGRSIKDHHSNNGTRHARQG